MALINLSPVVLTIFAAGWLGGKVGRRETISLLLGFSGMLICIRPESISMTEHDEDAAENRISGQVRSSIYLGSQVQYDVDIGADHPIKVNLFNPRRLPVLPEGTQVYLGFASEDAVLLPAGGAGKDPAV